MVGGSTVLRNWPAFLDSVRRLNEFVCPGVLRRYQADLLNLGEFAVASPFTGEMVVSRCNAVGAVGRTGYYFSAADDFFLLLRRDSFEFGYPLREFVSGKDGARIHLLDDEARWGKVGDDEFARLLQSGRDAPDFNRLKYHPAMLVLGHK